LFENEVKKQREAPDPQKVIVERGLEKAPESGMVVYYDLSKRIVIRK